MGANYTVVAGGRPCVGTVEGDGRGIARRTTSKQHRVVGRMKARQVFSTYNFSLLKYGNFSI